MKYFTPYRFATYLLLVFCAGHTGGGMFAQKSLGPEADTVFAAMKSVHFNFNGGNCTYYGFWFGFGLVTSIFMLLSAALCWWLAGVEAKSWRLVRPVAWALILSQAANAMLSWKYFFAGPGILATLITALVIAGAITKVKKST